MNKTKLIASSILGLSSLGMVSVAQASDDLGCEFVLCMGAKNPLGIAECVSPVKKVLKMVKKGKKPPICRGQDGKKIDYSVSFIPSKPVAGAKPNNAMPPLGAGNNGIPVPSPIEYCPTGLRTGNAMYHTDELPVGYEAYKEINLPLHPFSDYRIPDTNLVTIVKGKKSNALGEYISYSQRVCVPQQVKAYINQTNQDGKGKTLHAWVDKAVLLKGSDANKQVWIGGNIPNALGKSPMLPDLVGKEVTPETIRQVEQARDDYIQEYENRFGEGSRSGVSSSSNNSDNYIVNINGEKKSIKLN